ncbi:unnamed protein product [Adineta steineri]|uniref:Protein quiver n=1 Tax=Adineta steineri TaxID=433720 RepID=A0A819CAR8_9BILA|nr:unnamed protein product [Adineta steineri]CAF1187965.1 unnamed protein product [Adineta steineri]CAF1202495.1 unnamed protein product [Adineta steineri]CAF1270665.1 unnamed protein product [Adineta steineri]CAF1325766.1 unnamed protein product [Adineta steineri]
MQISIVIELFFLFIFSTNRHHRSSYFVQADSASCRKQVECFMCDSRENPACEDSRTFSQIQMPTRLCDDYCLKVWTRENDTVAGDDKTTALRYVRRDCHKIFRYHIKKAETCYQHKKHHTDSFCLCSSDRCNSSINIRLKHIYFWIFFIFFIFYCNDVFSLVINY